MAGALAVLTGWLSPAGAVEVLERSAPVLGFLVAVTVLAELADDAGLFEAGASVTARLGRGSVRRLFLLVCLLCTVTTVVLSLDTTAVLLTPVVLAMCRRLGLPALPFAFATIWLANAASLLLPVSNLTNLLAAEGRGLGALEYARHAALPQLAVLAVTLAVLLLRHRRALRGAYGIPESPQAADPALLRTAGLVTAVVAALLVAGLPPWAVATGGALVLVSVYAAKRRDRLRLALLPWRLVVMTVGLFLVVQGLQEHGLTRLLHDAAGDGEGSGALLRLTGVAAGAANAVNNLPAYLAVEPVAGSAERLLAALVGVNAGPLVLLWGSLATLLWRDRCAARGLHVGAWAFAREGLLLVPPALVAGALAIGI
nr:SLC13 family permease [Motilibacter aurantiacus]